MITSLVEPRLLNIFQVYKHNLVGTSFELNVLKIRKNVFDRVKRIFSLLIKQSAFDVYCIDLDRVNCKCKQYYTG